jgi:putative aminopeptidase FrvX
MERNKDTMIIRLDELVHSKDDTKKLGIANGDYIALDPKTEITPSGYIKSRFLDDKLSVAIIFELLKHLKEENITPKNTIKVIISTYEEVGFGSSYIPFVNELLAVDMGCVGEHLEGSEEKVSICAKDSSGPYNYEMNTKLINLAKQNNLDFAVDVFPYYSSDVSAALKAGNNIKGALIGSGVAASHGMERTHIKGIINTFELLKAYVLN